LNLVIFFRYNFLFQNFLFMLTFSMLVQYCLILKLNYNIFIYYEKIIFELDPAVPKKSVYVHNNHELCDNILLRHITRSNRPFIMICVV